MDSDDRATLANIKELMKLYGVSEAEEHLILQLLALIGVMGWSRKLTIKLLNVVVRALEMIQDEEDRVAMNKEIKH